MNVGKCITCGTDNVHISGLVGSGHGVCTVCDRIVQKSLKDGSWHKMKEKVDSRNREIEQEFSDWFAKKFNKISFMEEKASEC